MNISKIKYYDKNTNLDYPILGNKVHYKISYSELSIISLKGFVDQYPKNVQSLKDLSFADLYFNRIHLFPKKINFGLIDSKKEKEIELWNSYFENKTLIETTGDFSQGLSFNEPVFNVVYKMNSSKVITLVAETDGTNTIDTTFNFNFSDTYALLKVEGKRNIYIFDIVPRSEKSEIYSFNTDIIRAESGNEQRIQLLQDSRLVFNYNYLVEKYDIQRIEYLIFSSQAKEILIPKWSQNEFLQSKVNVSDNVIYFDTRFKDIAVGSLLMLKDNNVTESIEILEVYNDRIISKFPIEKSFEKNSYIVPVVYCYIDNITKSNHTNNVAEFNISFKIAPKENLNIINNVYEFETYRDLELILTQPNKISKINTTYNRDSITLDPNFGVINVYDINKQNFNSFNYEYILTSKEEIQNFKTFLNKISGRSKPFYMPSFQDDLYIDEFFTYDLTKQSFLIKSVDYQTTYLKSFRDIIIYYKDSTYSIYRIINAEKSNDLVGYDNITLDRTFDKITSYDNIDSISFLNKSRFLSDSSTINFITDEIATVTKNIQTLKFDDI